MSRSVLLQLARDSIQEVLEAKRAINKEKLLKEYPLLDEKISSTVNIYLAGKLRGTAKTNLPLHSLLEDIIKNSKKAAFEDKDFEPITTSQYLNSEIEIILITADGEISEKDPSILKTTSYKISEDF